MSTSSVSLRAPAGFALLAVLLAGCASPSDARPGSSAGATPAIGDGHGFVAGAAEMPEPQLRLVTLGTAGLQAFDPATGSSVVLLGEAEADSVLSSDGRYAFAADADGGVTVIDTGTWTVPHGDHSHYYLAEPRLVGRLDEGPAAGTARLASRPTLTTASFPGLGDAAPGSGVVLDGDALAAGRLEERARIPLAPGGVLVPLGDQLVGSTAGPGSEVVLKAYSADGMEVGGSANCEDPAGSALTRVGAVFGCADGAVLATIAEQGDGGDGDGDGGDGDGDGDGDGNGGGAGATIAFERIPYPAGTEPGDRATSFAARPGRPDLAAVAGDRGAWLLDTRDRTWTLLPSPAPLLRATAVGDADGTVVGVDVEGRIVVLDAQGAAVRSEPVLAAELVDGGAAGGGSAGDGGGGSARDLPDAVVLEVDADRAYVNAPRAGTVLEIAYRDSARIARTLEIPGGAAALMEVGR